MSDKTKGLLQCLLVVLIIIASFTISNLLGTKQAPLESNYGGDLLLKVETVEVSPGPYRIAFETTGNVQARSEISVTPQVSGRVEEVSPRFFEGGVFQAGETVFKIESLDFELEAQRLKAEVARAETNLLLEQAEAEAAIAEWQQIHGDKDPPDLVVRKPQVAEARANLLAAKAQLADAQLDVERTRFSLPFNGRVLTSNLAKGQYVNAGQSYGTVFDVETLEVGASLDNRQLEWLLTSANPTITITVNALGTSNKFKAYLLRGVSSFNEQTRFANVNFGFEEVGRSILPGMFVDIRIEGSQLDDILLLPVESLQKDGRVWHVNGDETLSFFQPIIIYAHEKYLATRWNGRPINVVTTRLSGAIEGMRVEASKLNMNDSLEERLSKKVRENGRQS